ncbi:unnamed protein product [Aureobasidium vineae]|uniref:Mob1/phocein n=1 Tax=Aureobasidium vineae TaxID=2773715 RepID=A0A9N8JW40_9PEZI|nr:unnamed protein product [Aureobasidium vineae]
MASPSSSPRLPSPPPIAEDQISPSAGLDSEERMLGASHKADVDAQRRIRPGTKAEDMQEGPPLVELQQIDSAFQLTEHLKALHNEHTQSCRIAIDKAMAQSLAQPPPGVDRGIWFEWQYLCAAHEPPKSCCAIDYCCHTLDWCATALTSTKLFPSRLGLGTETLSAQAQIRKMTEVFRRVYRIFAHAWFSHRDVFWRVESKTGLYLLFKTVCDEYRLIPEDNYTIPPEAEGIETTPVATRAAPTVLQRDSADSEPVGNATLATGNTTKRHRHTMSHDRSVSVSTVIHEEVEEDEDPEQPTGHGPLLLTRVETARHEEEAAARQAQEQEKEPEIPAEDPPPYAEESAAEQSEKTQPQEEESTSNLETDAGEASTSKSTPDDETGDEQETSEYPSSDPPSYAEIASAASTSETANDTPSTSAASEEPATDPASPIEAELTETSVQNATEDTKTEESELEAETETTEVPKESAIQAEVEAAPEPAEVAEADAADETEATKTVAD